MGSLTYSDDACEYEKDAEPTVGFEPTCGFPARLQGASLRPLGYVGARRHFRTGVDVALVEAIGTLREVRVSQRVPTLGRWSSG